ncbi:hypothetical protein ABZS95_42945 [Streptomyces sp. NPDC005479]|uniref:hypothetical protein n=1 Tax=unclassified Streptomyces TaxID=2593676 RepID=UPI0033A26239
MAQPKRLADAAAPEDLFHGQWQNNRTSVLDEYKPYLDDRWNDGCTNAWQLWEELVPPSRPHRGMAIESPDDSSHCPTGAPAGRSISVAYAYLAGSRAG